MRGEREQWSLMYVPLAGLTVAMLLMRSIYRRAGFVGERNERESIQWHQLAAGIKTAAIALVNFILPFFSVLYYSRGL
jgi:hypothetical protein